MGLGHLYTTFLVFLEWFSLISSFALPTRVMVSFVITPSVLVYKSYAYL
jgi:hypothetical protein